MARLARRTVTWKFRGEDDTQTCEYFYPLSHEHKAEALAANEDASVEDQLAVTAYNNATSVGAAVIVDVDTVEVDD